MTWRKEKETLRPLIHIFMQFEVYNLKFFTSHDPFNQEHTVRFLCSVNNVHCSVNRTNFRFVSATGDKVVAQPVEPFGSATSLLAEVTLIRLGIQAMTEKDVKNK